MSNLQQYRDQSNAPAAYTPADSSRLMTDPAAFNQLYNFASAMAQSQSMIPSHMRGNVGDCMAVAMQALQWGMNPYAVAQKTFVVGEKGVLGYEAQLINAVITANAPITGRLNFEWFGPWEKILGKFTEKPSKFKDNNGQSKTYKAPAWSAKDEEGLGVEVWATLVGESEPRKLSILMTQALTRNSTLWTEDPKQQIAYLAIKRWARLYCPDVIMGVYSQDELRDRNTSPRDITPRTKNKGAAGLLDRITKPIPDEEDAELAGVFLNPDDLLFTIKGITQLRQCVAINDELKAIEGSEGLKIDPADLVILKAELAKIEAPLRNEYKTVLKQVRTAETIEDIERLREVVKDKSSDYPDIGVSKLEDEIELRLEALQQL